MPQPITQRPDGACLIRPADAEPLLVPDDSQMSDPVLAVVIAHLRQRGYIVIYPDRIAIARYNQHACPLCERPNEP
jgi:hypothetical protein